MVIADMSKHLRELKTGISRLSLKELEALADWCDNLVDKQRYEMLCDTTEGIDPKDVLKKFKGNDLVLRGMEGGMAATEMEMFYREVRVRGCRFQDDADMLLAEWGPATKTEFYLAYTRQLMPPRPDGGTDVLQLRLELRYPMTEQLRKLKEGNRWFGSLKKLDAFTRFSVLSPVGRATDELVAKRVTLTYRNAE